MSTTNEEQRYARFGKSAIIPGFQAAIDFLQERLDALRTEIEAFEGAALLPKVKRGRPPKQQMRIEEGLRANGQQRKWHARDPNHPDHAEWVAKIRKAKGKNKSTSGGIKGYWAAMTPEQRSAEMARRAKKGLGRKPVVALKKGVAA